MSAAPRTVLITGAAGVVGRAVAAELRCRSIGLVHGDRDVPEADETLAGDLELPRLGLDEPAWRALAERVDAIVHSAALTEWRQPRERYEAVNVEGTRRVIELARAAGAPVHYISTIFVLALLDGDDRLGAGNLVREYIHSKLACERLLAV